MTRAPTIVRTPVYLIDLVAVSWGFFGPRAEARAAGAPEKH